MKARVKTWLEEGRVDLFLGFKMCDGHPLPHLFSKNDVDELDELVVSPSRYPLEKLAADILAEEPGVKIAMLSRDCDRRALTVLVAANQLSADSIRPFDVSCCASRSKDQTDCSSLLPEESGKYKKRVGIDRNLQVEEIEKLPPVERFQRWMYEFQKCIRCYGCRNICPVCYCRDCSLENADLVEKGPLPPEVPIFHLVRAVHMAGRCIDCGLCEEACPVDIPLRLLYRKVNSTVSRLFDYDAGRSARKPPFAVVEDTGAK